MRIQLGRIMLLLVLSSHVHAATRGRARLSSTRIADFAGDRIGRAER